jgi:hypothetical protein
MVKGAWWRSTTNLAFFAALQESLLRGVGRGLGCSP